MKIRDSFYEFLLEKHKISDNWAVIDGVHYTIGDGKSFPKGFSGQHFTIEYFDGRIVETDDLWLNGTIDPEWKDQFPNNAKFLWSY